MNEEKIVIYRANGQITTIHVYTPEELGRDRFDSIEQRNAEYNESPNNKKRRLYFRNYNRSKSDRYNPLLQRASGF